jgi:hypothetical protein
MCRQKVSKKYDICTKDVHRKPARAGLGQRAAHMQLAVAIALTSIYVGIGLAICGVLENRPNSSGDALAALPWGTAMWRWRWSKHEATRRNRIIESPFSSQLPTERLFRVRPGILDARFRSEPRCPCSTIRKIPGIMSSHARPGSRLIEGRAQGLVRSAPQAAQASGDVQRQRRFGRSVQLCARVADAFKK